MWPEPGNVGKHSLVKFKPTTKKLVKSQGDKKKNRKAIGNKEAKKQAINLIIINQKKIEIDVWLIEMKNSQPYVDA